MLKDQSTSETPHCNLPVPLPNEKAVVDLIHGLKDGDLVSAATAAAAVASILRSKEHGRSVDPNLLIELLRDPKMMWKLVDKNELGAEVKTRPIAGPEPIASFPLPSSTEDGEPSSRKTPAISKRVTEKELIPMPSTKPRTRSQTVGACGKTHSGILPIAAPKPVKQATRFWRSNSGTSMDSVQQTKAISGAGRYHFPSMTMGHSAPLLKDSDYCKSLVKQYGETQVNEKHEVSKIGQPGKCLHGLEFPRNIKFELDLNNQLPSMYLNGQGGDRVWPGRVVETSVAKRMKLG